MNHFEFDLLAPVEDPFCPRWLREELDRELADAKALENRGDQVDRIPGEAIG